MSAESSARANQLRRTRKDLLKAAGQLARSGRSPTLEEVAEAAMVSRATAYRHFPDIHALMLEAALDIDTPQAESVFRGAPKEDPVARLERVDAAIEAMIRDNEVPLRLMLKHSLERSVRPGETSDLPLRQNRRAPLIDAALEPTREQFRPAALKTLSLALAMVIGPEAMLALKDVMQLNEAEARRVRRWALRALVDAARKSAGPG
ncbi:TetR/AcrR family transcriptional regulator [Paucibacter soli]|uniref:TetR/AcrR family transcriptional regulator n=1 Tax=Paucibacter soli TaxID=3133433 RepID=UPI0030A71E36